MGAWGTGINQNDTYQDLLMEFMNLYHDGVELMEIPDLINERNGNIADDIDEYSSYWFAMAMGQWKCGNLEPDVLKKVQEIYDMDKGLDLWSEASTDKQAFLQHKKSIAKFLEKLKSINEKPSKRKPVVPRPCYFQSGDCLSIKLSNGLYGAAYIITHSNDPKDGQNIAALVNYFSEVKPTVDDILNSPILRHDYSGWPNRLAVKIFMARSMSKYQNKIELVGTKNLSPQALEILTNGELAHVGFYDLWSWSETDKMLTSQHQFNKSGDTEFDKVTINQLVSDNCQNSWRQLLKLHWNQIAE